jgi:hypothetical protein
MVGRMSLHEPISTTGLNREGGLGGWITGFDTGGRSGADSITSADFWAARKL